MPRPAGHAAGAALAGALVGAADALAVVAADTLPREPARAALLCAADAAATGLVAGVAAGVLALLPPLRRAAPARWWGFLVGLGLAVSADAAERWFRAPPPFTEPPPLHGNPAVFAAGLAALALALWAVGRLARSSRARALAVLAVSALLAARVAGATRHLPPRGHPPADAPNVLLVTVDTTRADHMGGDRARTPHFDALAAEGARFDLAVSQIPVTGPSHLTIMSGLGPWTHGNLLNGLPAPADVPLLAERLRAAGWRTGAFVSAYVLDRSIGLDRGFEVYDDDFGRLPGWSRTAPGRLLAAVERHLSPDEVLERRGDRTVDHALAWLDGLPPGEPFLLWVHLFDPHGPYTPPAPWDAAYYEGDPRDPAHTSMAEATDIAAYLRPFLRGITDADWVRARYAGEVSWADEQLGRLLDHLDARGLAPRTLVLVAGDHGESLGEHGEWFNHGLHLYDEATRVPMALRFPGRVPAGTVVSDPVELTDVTPTVLDLLGLDPPEGLDGRSEAPALFGGRGRAWARSIAFDRRANRAARERGEADRPVYRMVSLRSRTRRYLWREAPGTGEALYDVVRDPEEVRPVDATEDVVGPLRAEAEALVAGMGREAAERAATELDPATRSRLQALGYMEE